MTAATLQDELTRLRTGAALCTPDLRFVMRARGGDLLPWLDRICSNPVADIQPGQCVSAVLMDGKGRMRTDLRVLAVGDPAEQGLLLDLPLSHRAQLARLLDMYIINDDVQVEDLSTELRTAVVLGPGAADALRAVGLEAPAAGALTTHGDVTALPSALLPGAGYDLIFGGDAGRDLIDGLFAAGAQRIAPETLEVERVLAGVPRFAQDLAVEVIPLEANLDDHVSTKKGCYPGQEVVARIVNLGQVARRLMRLSAAGEQTFEAGVDLCELDGEQRGVGMLTSSAYDPGSDTTHALGYVRRKAWNPGTRVQIGGTELEVLGPADRTGS